MNASGLTAGRVSLVARRGTRTVARGTAKANKAGRATIRLVFTAKARRSLRRSRRAVLSIRGGGAAARVVLRR